MTASFYDLRAILSDADALATLERYYERGWDRLLAALALGVIRPGAMRTRELLAKLRAIIANLDPRKDSAVRHWIREWVREAFLAGEDSALAELDDSAKKSTAADAVSTITNAIASLDQKLGVVAAQMYATASAAVLAVHRAILRDPNLRAGVTDGILRSRIGQEIGLGLQAILLDGLDPITAGRLTKNGIPRFVVDMLDGLNRKVIQVGKAAVNALAYARQAAQDALVDVNNSASILVGGRNGIDHVYIDKDANRKLCAFCAGVEFNVFYNGPEDVDPAGFPNLRDLPPGPKWHPNCTHVAKPWPIASKTQAEIAAALASSLAIPGEFYGPGAVAAVNAGSGSSKLRKLA